MPYPRNEQETTCVYDYETNEWTVYTCVQKHLSKCLKRFGEPAWTEKENDRIIAAKWTVKANQVVFAKISHRKPNSKGKPFAKV